MKSRPMIPPAAGRSSITSMTRPATRRQHSSRVQRAAAAFGGDKVRVAPAPALGWRNGAENTSIAAIANHEGRARSTRVTEQSHSQAARFRSLAGAATENRLRISSRVRCCRPAPTLCHSRPARIWTRGRRQRWFSRAIDDRADTEARNPQQIASLEYREVGAALGKLDPRARQALMLVGASGLSYQRGRKRVPLPGRNDEEPGQPGAKGACPHAADLHSRPLRGRRRFQRGYRERTPCPDAIVELAHGRAALANEDAVGTMSEPRFIPLISTSNRASRAVRLSLQ
jgi:hypothetical protein